MTFRAHASNNPLNFFFFMVFSWCRRWILVEIELSPRGFMPEHLSLEKFYRNHIQIFEAINNIRETHDRDPFFAKT